MGPGAGDSVSWIYEWRVLMVPNWRLGLSGGCRTVDSDYPCNCPSSTHLFLQEEEPVALRLRLSEITHVLGDFTGL